jgi:hypothetical protein
MHMAGGAWECRVGAVGAVLAAAFGAKAAPVNPYQAGGSNGKVPSASEAAKVRRDVSDAMFAEGLRQIARKSKARQASTG